MNFYRWKNLIPILLCVILCVISACGEVEDPTPTETTSAVTTGKTEESTAETTTEMTTETTTETSTETATEITTETTAETEPEEVCVFNPVLSYDWAQSYWEARMVTELDLAEAENWGLAALAGGFELTYAETYTVTVEESEKSGAEFVYTDEQGRKIWVSFGDGMYFVAPAACNPCDLGLGQALLFSADGRPDRNLFLEGTLEAGNVKIYTYGISEEEFLSFADEVFVSDIDVAEKKTSTELVFNPVSSYIAHDYGIGYAPIEDINAALSEAELPENLGGLSASAAERSAREEEDLKITYDGENGMRLDVIHCSKEGNIPFAEAELMLLDEPTVSVLEKGSVVAYVYEDDWSGNLTFYARMSRGEKLTYLSGYNVDQATFEAVLEEILS